MPPPDISDMREISVLMRDAEAVADCMYADDTREEFLREFNATGWNIEKMRDAIRLGCNNIPQCDPSPVISFYPYTI